MAMTIPKLGLGTWKVAKDVAQSVVYNSIKELGIRHIDCACDYGNEVEVGMGIKQAIDEGIVKREELWVTTKLWNTYHLEEHVELACRKSMEDLQLEYLDLYLIHFPIALKFVPFEKRYPPEWIHDPDAENPKVELEPKAPMHLTWKAMEGLMKAGLTRNIGVCNFNVQLLSDLLSYATIRPYANQIELHPYLTQQALLDYCQLENIHVTAFSPFGSSSYVEIGMDGGLGKGLLDLPMINAIAASHGSVDGGENDKTAKSPAQVLLRWAVQRGTSVIPKASQLHHMAENANIFDFELTEDEMAKISALNQNIRFNDPGVYGKFMGRSMPIFC